VQGRALLILAGRYMVSKPLNVSCRTPPYCDPQCYSHSCSTHQPAKIVGEGALLTYVVAAGRIESVFNLAGAAFPVVPGTKHAQPAFNYSSGHEISDLTIQCYNISDPNARRDRRSLLSAEMQSALKADYVRSQAIQKSTIALSFLRWMACDSRLSGLLGQRSSPSRGSISVVPLSQA
jgi:hypothetical protein